MGDAGGLQIDPCQARADDKPRPWWQNCLRLGEPLERVHVTWPNNGEVASVERRYFGRIEPFCDCDDRRVRAAERKIAVGDHESAIRAKSAVVTSTAVKSPSASERRTKPQPAHLLDRATRGPVSQTITPSGRIPRQAVRQTEPQRRRCCPRPN